MKKESAGDIFEPEKPIVPADWDVIPFEKAAHVISDRGKRVKQGTYLLSGKLPVIDQGQDYIGGYVDDESMAFDGQMPVVLFGDHTRSVKYVDKRFAVGAEGVKILRPAECYEPKFFYYLLQSLRIPSRGYSRHFQFLRRFHFPVAPKLQQKRIVAEIEKQFSRLDEAVANLKRVKANLKRYKAAVLKAAVEGKLTEDWRKAHPDVEPASELLKRILAERRAKREQVELDKMKAAGKEGKNDKWKKRYKEPTGPESESLPRLPPGWSWATPEQLASPEDYSLAIGPFGSNLKVSDYKDSGVPLIFVRNIRTGIFSDENTKYISEEKAKQLRAHIVAPGDLLITKMGDPPGDATLYPYYHPAAVITADCIKWKLSPLILHAEFFVHAVNSEIVRNQILKITKGVAQQKVSLARFRSIAIPFPSATEQGWLAQEIGRRLSLAEGITSETDKSIHRSERLRQSILRKAFTGQLVASQVGEESASALLERINAERGPGAVASERKKGPKLGRRRTMNTKRSLVEVVREYPDGITPERLLTAANYSLDEVDRFYAELSRITSEVEIEKPSGSLALKWPSAAEILIRAKVG